MLSSLRSKVSNIVTFDDVTSNLKKEMINSNYYINELIKLSHSKIPLNQKIKFIFLKYIEQKILSLGYSLKESDKYYDVYDKKYLYDEILNHPIEVEYYNIIKDKYKRKEENE